MTMNVKPRFCPLSHRCREKASRTSHIGTLGTGPAHIYVIRDNKQMEEPISLRERIERYVDACPPAISGQRGHDQPFEWPAFWCRDSISRPKTPSSSWLVTTNGVNHRGPRESYGTSCVMLIVFRNANHAGIFCTAEPNCTNPFLVPQYERTRLNPSLPSQPRPSQTLFGESVFQNRRR